MFGFFKPREKPSNKDGDLAALLSMDDITYSNTVFQLFENMDAATRAHVVVAYENLLPMLSALYTHGEKSGQRFTVEEFIRKVSASLGSYSDEINSRRMAWFLFAALLGRLEKIARGNVAISIVGARIWCILVSELPRLKVLLPQNAVWKNAEKAWFDLSVADDKMIQNGINHVIPPIFAKAEPVKNLAKSLGLFYWPSETRIGIIP